MVLSPASGWGPETPALKGTRANTAQRPRGVLQEPSLGKAPFPGESPQGPSDLPLPFPGPQLPHLQRKRPGPSPGTPITCLGPLCWGCERTGGKGRAALRLRCVLIYRGNDCSVLITKGKGASLGPQSGPRRDAVRSSSLSQRCLEETSGKNKSGVHPPRRRDQSRQGPGFKCCTPLRQLPGNKQPQGALWLGPEPHPSPAECGDICICAELPRAGGGLGASPASSTKSLNNEKQGEES